MSKFSHILKEVLKNIFRNFWTSFSSVLVLTLLFLLFDLFWIGAGTSDKFYNNYISELQMEVFIGEGTSDSTITDLEQYLTQLDGVKEVKFISKDLAKDLLTELVGVDLLIGYDSINPLPQSFIISFNEGFPTINNLDSLESNIISRKEISHTYYSKSWLTKAEKTKKIITDIGIILGALILLTVLLSSATSMQLSTKARASGFYQMRLLGAGKLLLAMPFIIEGFLIGAVSAGIGWSVILYWKNKIDFVSVELVFPRWEDIIFFCLGAGLLGIISGYLGIKRQLK